MGAFLDMFLPGASNYLTPTQQSDASNLGLLNGSLDLIDASSNHYGLKPSLLQLMSSGLRGYGTGVGAYAKNIPTASTATLADAQNKSALALMPYYDQQAKAMMGQNPVGTTGTPATPFGMGNGSAAPSGGSGGAPSGAPDLSYVSPYFRQALMAAYMSRDPKQISSVLSEMGKVDPQGAAAVTRATQFNTFQKTPQGTFEMPSQGGGSAVAPPPTPTSLAAFYPQPLAPAPAQGNVPNPQDVPPVNASALQPGAIPAPPTPAQLPPQGQPPAAPQAAPQRDFAAMPPQPTPPMAPQQASAPGAGGPPPLTALDGKPYVPNPQVILQHAPDPSGTPRYNTENTETGVNQTKQFQSNDIAADQKIGEAAMNANQMQSRVNDMVSAMKSGQAGTLLAQYPDLATKLVGAGIINNKGDVNNVAQYQRVMADQIVEILNQIKSASAGTSQSRILNSEIQGMMTRMADPGQQPQAIRDILAMAQGLGNYNQDMAKGWSTIGGLGNRAAGGYTMRPDSYQQEFTLNHNIDDYVNIAKQNMGPLAGMAAPNQQHIQLLQQNATNPAAIQQFEQKFGPGSAKRYLMGGAQ